MKPSLMSFLSPFPLPPSPFPSQSLPPPSPHLSESHLPVLLTALCRHPCACVRSNAMIAVSDLCLRWPNALEPWTRHVYTALADSSTAVRLHAVQALSHLILNEMMKVRGRATR